MTEYSRFINKVKEKCDSSWFTPSQKNVFDKITTGFTNHRVVNIFSRGGFGKTFIGWVIEKEGLGMYFTSPDSVQGTDLGVVIIDNFPPSRDNHRRFRSQMGKWGISKAIVLTQYAIPDDIPSMELDFNEEDRKRFKHACYHNLRFQITNETGQEDMHDLIKKNIWEWSYD